MIPKMAPKSTALNVNSGRSAAASTYGRNSPSGAVELHAAFRTSVCDTLATSTSGSRALQIENCARWRDGGYHTAAAAAKRGYDRGDSRRRTDRAGRSALRRGRREAIQQAVQRQPGLRVPGRIERAGARGGRGGRGRGAPACRDERRALPRRIR